MKLRIEIQEKKDREEIYLNWKPSISMTSGLMEILGNSLGVLFNCSFNASTWLT